jgi:hypothetical protein
VTSARSLFLSAAIVAQSISPAVPVAAAGSQTAYVPGVFVAASYGPVELIAWAEVATSGQLRMARGTIDDVPTIRDVKGVLCNLPNWKPTVVVLATDRVFSDERAERRQLPFSIRTINLTAVEMRIADLERTDRVAKLLRDIRATEQSPAYLFIGIGSNGLGRYYPVRLGTP